MFDSSFRYFEKYLQKRKDQYKKDCRSGKYGEFLKKKHSQKSDAVVQLFTKK